MKVIENEYERFGSCRALNEGRHRIEDAKPCLARLVCTITHFFGWQCLRQCRKDTSDIRSNAFHELAQRAAGLRTAECTKGLVPGPIGRSAARLPGTSPGHRD